MTLEVMIWAWLLVGAAYYLAVVIMLHSTGDLEVVMHRNPAAMPIAVLLTFIIAWPVFLVHQWLVVWRERSRR